MSYVRFATQVLCSSFFAAVLAGCAASASDDGSAEAAAALDATPVLHFDVEGTEFHQLASSSLHAGTSVRVDYDADRLTTCRGDQGGIPQWTITGFYKIDNGPVRMFPAGGLGLESGPPAIVLDRPGDLAVWFQNTSRWGCSAYDSAFGANYHFKVAGF